MNENPNREYGLYPSSNIEDGTSLDQYTILFDQEETQWKVSEADETITPSEKS